MFLEITMYVLGDSDHILINVVAFLALSSSAKNKRAQYLRAACLPPGRWGEGWGGGVRGRETGGRGGGGGEKEGGRRRKGGGEEEGRRREGGGRGGGGGGEGEEAAPPALYTRSSGT